MKSCAWKSSWVYGLALLFLPKCPMCWMAYLSLSGSLGLVVFPYTQGIFYFLFAGFVVLLCFQTLHSFRTGEFRAVIMGAIVLSLIVTWRFFNLSPWLGLFICSTLVCLRWVGEVPLAKCIRKGRPGVDPSL